MAASIATTIASPDQTGSLSSRNCPAWAHPEVKYWFPEWKMTRDACAGEKSIKASGTAYLPKLEGMTEDEYATFVGNATFFGFSGRTASALTGTIFRRKETLENFPDILTSKLEKISRTGEDFTTFAAYTCEEIIKMGRFGVLLDMGPTPTTDPRPYLAAYPAESIVDWDAEDIDGQQTLTMVMLWEVVLQRDPTKLNPKFVSQFRKLSLNNGVYEQELFSNPKGDAAPTSEFSRGVTVPKVRGKSLNYIPFHVFGTFLSSLAVEKATLHDIVRLNISHYRSYAHLEHGRVFAGFPLYFVESGQGGGESEAEFTLGASRVWVTPPGAKPGILELNGQGLKFLVDGLDQKEAQAASLGGRMIGVRSTAVAESDNQVALAERNEQAQLLKITRSLDAGFTKILRWWAQWNDLPEAQARKISAAFNKDFLFDSAGAREFRAIHTMYKDGVLPVEVLFHYMKKASVIPDFMSMDEFKSLLESEASFPNQVDVQARKQGYASAQAIETEQQAALNREADMELLITELDSKEKIAATAAKAAKQAADAAKATAAAAKKSPPSTPGSPAKPKATV